MRDARTALTTIVALMLAAFLLLEPCLAAEPETLGSVLIRNVRLSDPKARAEHVVVSLLVKQGKLEIVTQDEIPAEEADLALDAANGVLLGKLELGQPPSFLILDVDPRQEVEALLDTKTHARFAMRKGEIVKNTLSPAALPSSEQEQKKRTGWLAYTPPPLALPVSYADTTKWNRWESKYVSGIFVGALLLDRQEWLSSDNDIEQQVGDLDEFDGGEIRGLRFGAVGTFNFKRPWVYTVFAATNAFDRGFGVTTTDEFDFLDYRIDIPLRKGSALSIGKQKEPISMERIMSLAFEPMQERASVSDALLPSRNVGIVLNGTLADQRLTYAGGVFNDWFDADEDFDESATQWVGRVTGLPLISGDESALLHLGLGLRRTDAKPGLRFRTEPEFNMSPDFVDTGLFDADSAMTYSFEVSARKGPVWLAGEYLQTDVSAPAQGDPTFAGYHLTTSWIPTGEMRKYNKRSGTLGPVPVARPVDRGGWGTWELGARWSDLDLTDGAIDGGEMQVLSLGVNWWPTPWAAFSVDYRDITLDRFDTTGRADGVTMRLLLMLE
jgi:phosphate-selective porin OprO/OprP